MIVDFIPEQEKTAIKPFFESLKKGKLVTTYCPKCERHHWQPRTMCPWCSSMILEWRDLKEKGRLCAFSPDVSGNHCLGVVQLECGLKIFTGLEAAYRELEIGQEVFLKILRFEDGRVFFIFKTSI